MCQLFTSCCSKCVEREVRGGRERKGGWREDNDRVGGLCIVSAGNYSQFLTRCMFFFCFHRCYCVIRVTESATCTVIIRDCGRCLAGDGSAPYVTR